MTNNMTYEEPYSIHVESDDLFECSQCDRVFSPGSHVYLVSAKNKKSNGVVCIHMVHKTCRSKLLRELKEDYTDEEDEKEWYEYDDADD